MSEELKPPKRAFEVKLTISADDWQGIVLEVEHLADHLEQHGPVCGSVSGGPSSSHIVEVFKNVGMTHERYHQELEKYLAQMRAQKAATP
jgi:hypothetical protein